MIRHEKIMSSDNPLFSRCWELYNSAFPTDERRELEYQLQTMLDPHFSFDALYDGEQLVGIMGWWNFPEVRYIEHLAIFDSMRSGGYGRRVLENFIDQDPKMILLEVEHPQEELQQRRIGFYQRVGFQLNQHQYSHPPYIGDEYVDLMIMTYPTEISECQLNEFKQNYFPIIHFKHKI